MSEFDTSLRRSGDFMNWEANGAQLYAIEHEGQHYPPKKIISLATGTPVSEFSGGLPTNDYLASRGFHVVRIERDPSNPSHRLIPHFIGGKVYDRRRDIHEPFGGSRQSGISASQQVPAIFIFTGETGEQYGYRDSFDADGVFSYTGEGQVGDMQFTRGNLAIRDHAQTGRALHLFKSIGDGGMQQYVGEFSYASFSIRRGPDREGNQRNLIIFHLVPVSLLSGEELDPELGKDLETPPPSLAEAKNKALAAFVGSEGESGKTALRSIYRRSRQVRDYVLLRAAGVCESCGKAAPFLRKDGTPYLEPHHTTRVSDGGPDHPRYVAAICPACHREIHHGAEGEARNRSLIQTLLVVEPND